jgi:hypothetical protein
MFTTTAKKTWSTPYLAYFPFQGADCLEFLQVAGNGRMHPRHFLDFCAKRSELMDLVSDSKNIVVAIDPSYVEEASYIVNNLLCAILRAERTKITLQPASNVGRMISIIFYEGDIPAPSRPKAKKSHSKGHKHGHSSGRSSIHIF